MATIYYLADVQTELSYLQGFDSVPGTIPAQWSGHIQYAMRRIHRLHDLSRLQTTVNVTVTSGVGALSTTFRADPSLDVRIVNPGQGDDYIFTPVEQADFDNYAAGDYKYYISTSQTTGLQSLITTDSGTVQVTGQIAAPTLSASVGTPIDARIVAMFALVELRKAEDKDADVGPEEAMAANALEEIIGDDHRSRRPKKARTISELTGYFTGRTK